MGEGGTVYVGTTAGRPYRKVYPPVTNGLSWRPRGMGADNKLALVVGLPIPSNESRVCVMPGLGAVPTWLWR